MTIKDQIGRSIRAALKTKDRSQKWLSLTIESPANVVSKWSIHGTTNLDTIFRIAAAFDMKVSDFIALGEQE